MSNNFLFAFTLYMCYVWAKYASDYIFYIYSPLKSGYIHFPNFKRSTLATISELPLTSFMWMDSINQNNNIIQTAGASENFVWDIKRGIKDLMLFKNHGDHNQLFSFESNIDGTHQIINNKKCLTVSDKLKIERQRCVLGADNQKFLIIKMTTSPLNVAVDFVDKEYNFLNQNKRYFLRKYEELKQQNMHNLDYIKLDLDFKPIKRCVNATINDSFIEYNSYESKSMMNMDTMDVSINYSWNNNFFLSPMYLY